MFCWKLRWAHCQDSEGERFLIIYLPKEKEWRRRTREQARTRVLQMLSAYCFNYVFIRITIERFFLPPRFTNRTGSFTSHSDSVFIHRLRSLSLCSLWHNLRSKVPFFSIFTLLSSENFLFLQILLKCFMHKHTHTRERECFRVTLFIS